MSETKMEDESRKTEATGEEQPAPVPPLEAAARRLERLLGGGRSEKDRHLHTYTNPAKVVRRWLGTASGAAGNATFGDIAAAANALLDPAGQSAKGLPLLTSNLSIEPPQGGYLTGASCREVESWLISLYIRLLRKEDKLSDAFILVEKGIVLILGHLNVASTQVMSSAGGASSLYPLLARMYRYRSLVTNVLQDQAINGSLRQDMAKAHNMACLRRDVDCQASLLNLMLQDLINHSQSKYLMFRRVWDEVSRSQALDQLNRHKNYFRILRFRSPPPIISSAATCTTAVAFRPCAWSIQKLFRISVNACAKLQRTQALVFVLQPSASWL